MTDSHRKTLEKIISTWSGFLSVMPFGAVSVTTHREARDALQELNLYHPRGGG